MHHPSFDKFYFSKDGKLHDISEIQDMYETKYGNISYFKGYIFCPECEKAELRFTHQTSSKRAFLSKIPSSQHEGGCSYIYEYATKPELHTYIKRMDTPQMRDRLESALNRLFPSKRTSNVGQSSDNHSNPFIFEKKHGGKCSSIKRSIPRKSLNAWFDREMENQIFIFYGKVRLQVKEIPEKVASNGSPLYWLIVQTKQKGTWGYKTKIFRGITKDTIDENQVYALAVFGHIEFYRGHPQIKTETFDSILFREYVED